MPSLEQAPGFVRLALVVRGVERRRGDAEKPHLLDLVAHQRDQRRNDERQLAGEQCRQLEAERLAAPGRHDREDVLAGEHRGDDFRLAVAETVIAEDALQRRRGIVERHGHASAARFAMAPS